MENKRNILFILIATITLGFSTLVCYATDLVIESKNQSYSEEESKI